MRLEAARELSHLCGSRERLRQVLNQLACIVLPAPVQLLLSSVIRTFDIIYMSGIILQLAAAGLNVFDEGSMTGINKLRKGGVIVQCADTWMKEQSALLQKRSGSGPSSQAAQHTTQDSSAQAAQPSATESGDEQQAAGPTAGVNPLVKQVVDGVSGSGVFTPVSMVRRFSTFRDLMQHRYGLVLPSSTGQHLRGVLGEESGLRYREDTGLWSALVTLSDAHFLLASGVSETVACTARSLGFAVVRPGVLPLEEDFSDDDKLDFACWVFVAAANNRYAAAQAWQQLQQNSPMLALKVQALFAYKEEASLDYEPVLLLGLISMFRYQLCMPQQYRNTTNVDPSAGADTGGLLRSGRALDGSGPSSSPVDAAEAPSVAPDLAATRTTLRIAAAKTRLQQMAADVRQQLQKEGGTAQLSPLLMPKWYKNKPQLKMLVPLSQQLPDAVVFKGAFNGKGGKGTATNYPLWLSLSAADAQAHQAANPNFYRSTQPQLFVEVTAPYAPKRKSKAGQKSTTVKKRKQQEPDADDDEEESDEEEGDEQQPALDGQQQPPQQKRQQRRGKRSAAEAAVAPVTGSEGQQQKRGRHAFAADAAAVADQGGADAMDVDEQ